VYDQDTFEPIQEWSIPTKSQKDDDIEILYLTISPDETKIGVCLGRTLIKDHQEITELAIYKKSPDGRFELEKLRDFDLHDACIQFTFYKNNTEELLFFTCNDIFKFDYNDESKERETMYHFKNPLADQPKFGVFTQD